MACNCRKSKSTSSNQVIKKVASASNNPLVNKRMTTSNGGRRIITRTLK